MFTEKELRWGKTGGSNKIPKVKYSEEQLKSMGVVVYSGSELEERKKNDFTECKKINPKLFPSYWHNRSNGSGQD